MAIFIRAHARVAKKFSPVKRETIQIETIQSQSTIDRSIETFNPK